MRKGGSRNITHLAIIKDYMSPYMRFFLIFPPLSHQATNMDHGGPQKSDLSIERRRRNHFTTTPQDHHFEQVFVSGLLKGKLERADIIC